MAGETSRPGMRRWIGLLPVAVFLVSSSLLLYWWQDLTAAQGRSMQEHFELDALRVETKISERLAAYDEILRGAAGLFAASDGVSAGGIPPLRRRAPAGKGLRGDPGHRLLAPDPRARARGPRAVGPGGGVSRVRSPARGGS